MESEKYRSSSSDTSSEEDDQIKDDKKKRPYECTFCKRGFTNAQALGGHMNIHRKDRGKAKQTTNNYSKYNDDQYLCPTYSPSVTSESSAPNNYYPMIFESRKNYDVCFPLPPSNVSRNPYGSFNQQDQHNFRVTRPPVLSSTNNQEQQLWGANLSLQVGSTNVEGLVKDDELDLELRLGDER